MRRREAWFEQQLDLDPDRLVLSTRQALRQRWRAFTAERREASGCDLQSLGHWMTTTFIGALRLTGMTAPMVLNRAMTGDWFLAYVEQILVPTLQPDDIVILDNLPAHNIAGARKAIEQVGAKMLFLPPYSPDFNPIENAFSKLKTLLRKAAARTVDDLWQAIAVAIDTFTPDECRNYFAAAGYDAD